MDENILNILQDNWDEILLKHKEDFELQNVTFETYIRSLKIDSAADGVLILSSPENESAVNLIKKKYLRNLQLSICQYTDSLFEVEIISRDAVPKKEIPAPVPEKKSYVSLNDSGSFRLNPDYTFEKFIVGPNNNLAHSVSLAVADHPAHKHNPLFIYGGVGLGKTHLMQAIAHRIMKNMPDKKVLYVTSETFTNELIDCLRTGKKNSDFREKYRNIDILLIDDIQFIIGKESTQEEFFHTFNDLYQYGKQIVLTSDKPPKDMETLPDRLKSRFSEGMICDIQIPTYETKRAILDQKIEDRHLHNIPDDVRDYIVNNVKSSIRELEGSINTLQAYVDLDDSELSLEVAKEALKDYVSPEHNKVISSEYIIDIVSEHFGVTVNDILSPRRSTEITFPRQVVMYLCRQMTTETADDIGKSIGGRDHSTVLYGAKQISKELLSNDQLKNTIEILMKKIDPTT